MARRIRPYRVQERLPLSNGSVLEVLARDDRRGTTTFMHVSANRAQVFTTNLDEWLRRNAVRIICQ